MDERQMIPLIVYDRMCERDMKIIKSLVAIIIVLIVLIFAFIVTMSFIPCETGTETTVSQDGGGLNNYNVGEQGGVTYGETDDKD